jgi:Zn finger protein HypA/HybF involved in hydrogenase expression
MPDMREHKLDIECPGCKHRFKARIKELKPGHAINCPNCKRTIRLQGDDIESKVNEALDAAKRTFKNISKDFKI